MAASRKSSVGIWNLKLLSLCPIVCVLNGKVLWAVGIVRIVLFVQIEYY